LLDLLSISAGIVVYKMHNILFEPKKTNDIGEYWADVQPDLLDFFGFPRQFYPHAVAYRLQARRQNR
jgi:hypothetical protein